MLKKLSIIIASILLIGAILASPYIYEDIQFNKGNMVKVIDAHEVLPTAQGGFAMHFTVQDNEGNTYAVYSGFVAQWDKSEGDYINTKYIKR
jgi:hypothetical protein